MKIKLGKLKITLSLPLCCIMTAVILIDTSQTVILGCIAAVLHEMGHLMFMKYFDSFPNEIKITLFDIAIIDNGKGSRPLRQELPIVLGGVMMNLSFGAAFGILYWYFHYDFMSVFAGANMLLLFYNLLPVDTLDGGQALYLMLSSKLSEETTDKIMLIVSLIVLLPCTIFGFLLLFRSKYNFTLLLTSLYLISMIFLKHVKTH